MHISSGLSGTINSARVGAEQIKEAAVHIVDSMTLSGGQRFQVLAAAWAARLGWNIQTILERLEKNSPADRGDLHPGNVGIPGSRWAYRTCAGLSRCTVKH
ncbi:MAG: DegV family protein [Candidatus Villigracilaceae bacterium]